ncbi:MAG TPA: sugar phosphorylase, partial [Aggregatilineales bacterium]|nr:sugar phosphorylase [Aggregatilineales bacterium]
MSEAIYGRIMQRLTRLYGAEAAPAILQQIREAVGAAGLAPLDTGGLDVSERDVMLITYGDMLRRAGEAPLRTLHRFLQATAAPALNSVHLLPFFPYTSDDGFSVVDYWQINPDLGDWGDVRAMGGDFRLMFDAVFNHISQASDWFQRFLRDEAPYSAYFHVIDPAVDLSQVVRPRTLPLLTPFETPSGVKHVWTTFSADQIDLNFSTPAVLIETLRALLFYVAQGATFIRLDAIAFLWKVPGTSSIHLEETHEVIRLMRDVLDVAAPQVILITETNVPHTENISYFGDGSNEAQLVYNFALPPLTLHTLRTGDASALTAWAATLERPGARTTYFNFTASHDGVGVRPLTGLLPDDQIAALVEMTQDHGGLINYRGLPDGGRTPYELNITYFDAVTHPALTEADPHTAVRRFLVSQAIALALMGLPGVYFHSLYGSRNDYLGVRATGHNRSINREKFFVEALEAELNVEGSIRQQVYAGYKHLLEVRRTQAAFHPLAGQRVLSLHPAVFALERLP